MALSTLVTKRIAPKDYELSTVQGNLAAAVDPLLQIPFLNGNLFEKLKVTSGTAFTVTHGLGREYRGFFVVYASAPVGLTEGAAKDKTKQLVLTPNATVTLSLWVW